MTAGAWKLSGILLIAGFLSFVSAVSVFAAGEPRPATAEEQQLLNFLGIRSQMTTDEVTKGLKGGCDFNPYAVLESEFRGAGGITPRAGNDSTLKAGLDSALACRLVKLLRFAKERGCNFKIVSAFRATQGCGAPRNGCAAQGNSCHQYGLAADIASDRKCINWMLNEVLGIKRPNAGFGVKIAYFAGDYSHVHIQCNETPGATCTPATSRCDGGVQISADTSGIPNPGPASSPISNAIRNAINPQPAPQQLPQQTPPASAPPPLGTSNTTPYQAGTCAPQFYCSNNNLYYRSSSCVDQINQICRKGCSGVSCIDAPVSTDVLTTLLSTSTKPTPTATGTATKTVSVFEQLSAFAGPTVVTVTTNIATSVDLTGLKGQAVMTLDGNVQAQTHSGSLADTYRLAPPASQQTFVSPDLGQGSGVYTNPPQQSIIQKTLADMKAVVLRILEYLRPFGRAGGAVDYQMSE